MFLLDSNILFYSAQKDFPFLRKFITSGNYYSSISKVEVLGFHKLIEKNQKYFQAFFDLMSKLEIDSGIIELAIKIRQKSNIHVVDALIASTCIQHDLTLLTRNVEDFQKIAKLRMQNPIDK